MACSKKGLPIGTVGSTNTTRLPMPCHHLTLIPHPYSDLFRPNECYLHCGLPRWVANLPFERYQTHQSQQHQYQNDCSDVEHIDRIDTSAKNENAVAQDDERRPRCFRGKITGTPIYITITGMPFHSFFDFNFSIATCLA